MRRQKRALSTKFDIYLAHLAMCGSSIHTTRAGERQKKNMKKYAEIEL